jgi:hypothetical protein
MKTCHRCKKEVNVNKIIGRKDVCPFCRSDLRSCLNCRHHDLNVYNQCRESQADRVLEKDRSNFCDYFSYRAVSLEGNTNDDSENVRKKLDALFKV